MPLGPSTDVYPVILQDSSFLNFQVFATKLSTTVSLCYSLICSSSIHLFLPYSCPFLALQLTPVIPVVGGVLFLFVLGTLLRTSFSDPGVLPRASSDEAADLERQIGKTLI